VTINSLSERPAHAYWLAVGGDRNRGASYLIAPVGAPTSEASHVKSPSGTRYICLARRNRPGNGAELQRTTRFMRLLRK
jgi:hypothetical protein